MNRLPLEPGTLDRALRQAEDFLRRHLKSRAVREAEKRQRERRARETGRRLRRAATVGGMSGAGLVAFGLLAAPAAPVLAIAAGGALAAMTAALVWPGRQRATDGPLSSAELEALPAEAEEWLLSKRSSLPGSALPTIDAILIHLADIQVSIGSLSPASTLAWESRRLIGDHLPRLVHCYCTLPTSARAEDEALRGQLLDGLATIADELGRLSLEVNRDRLTQFETQGRFIESRYKEGGPSQT